MAELTCTTTAKRLRVWALIAAPPALLLLLTAVFFLCWFNRFAGIRSGAGEFAGGLAILAGKVPYRDYYNPGPPLNALKAALLMKLFGRSLLVLHAAAVVERLLLVVLLYRWLCRLFPRTAAWMASLTTIIVSAGDRTDPLASYNHDAILFGIAAAMCLDSVEQGSQAAEGRCREACALLFASGAFTSLSGLTKQTVGAGCFVFFLLRIAVRFWRDRDMAPRVLTYCSGVLAPLVPTALWLWHTHALAACIRMNLREGPSAKAGNALDFPRRMLLVAYDNAGWVTLGAFFAALSIWPLLRMCRSTVPAEKQPTMRDFWSLCTMCSLALAAAIIAGQFGWPTLHDQGKSAVYSVLLTLPAICLLLAQKWRRGLSDMIAIRRLLLFAGTGISIAFMLSLPGLHSKRWFCRGWRFHLRWC